MRGVFADLLGESGIVVQGRNNGRVRGTPRRRRPAWPSQFGDFEVSVPASGSDRGWPRGQTETVENLASEGRTRQPARRVSLEAERFLRRCGVSTSRSLVE